MKNSVTKGDLSTAALPATVIGCFLIRDTFVYTASAAIPTTALWGNIPLVLDKHRAVAQERSGQPVAISGVALGNPGKKCSPATRIKNLLVA
jgi:hypothetical protein